MADSDVDLPVDLTALEVIRRYSLAVRQPAADRAELLAALKADVAWLESAGRARPAARPTARARKTHS
jgi:hypothetical protein